MRSLLLGLAALSLISGCYYVYPLSLPRASAPSIEPGARIELSAKRGSYWSKCNGTTARDLEGCVFHNGSLHKRIEYADVFTTYGGKRLTLGELSELVVPEKRVAKWKKLDEYKQTCGHSFIPSTISIIGGVAQLVGVAFLDPKPDIGKVMVIGGAAVFLGAGALSYPIGGYACKHGRRYASENRLDHDNDTKWRIDPRTVTASSFAEIEAVVADFNRKQEGAERGGESSGDGTEVPPDAESNPSNIDPAETPDVPANVTPLELATSAGNFAIFLELVETAGISDRMNGRNDYTILIPTDAAFKKLPPAELASLRAPSTRREKSALRQRMLRYFTRTPLSLDEMVAKGKLDPAHGNKITITSKAGKVKADGVTVTDLGLKSSDGSTLYSLGAVLP